MLPRILISVQPSLLSQGLCSVSTQLTSNVERGGRHLACLGQVVVLTCRGMGAELLNWETAVDDEPIQIPYGLSNNEGDTVTSDPFTANLTEVVEEVSMRMLTSTLTFTFVEALNGVDVMCSTSINGDVVPSTARIEKTGNQYLSDYNAP